SVREGHAAANPSYVRRPSRSSADARVSSSLNWFPSSPRSNSNDQPSCLYPSPPPGASMTPSSEMNSVIAICPIRRVCLGLLDVQSLPDHCLGGGGDRLVAGCVRVFAVRAQVVRLDVAEARPSERAPLAHVGRAALARGRLDGGVHLRRHQPGGADVGTAL